MFYSHYNEENNGKKLLLKKVLNNNSIENFFQEKEKKSYIYNMKDKINLNNYKRLTQCELSNNANNILNKDTNNLFFNKSLNENNNKYIKKDKFYNSLKSFKNDKYLSSENISYEYNKSPMTVLINNGFIRNMYINNNKNKNKIIKEYNNINYTQNNINNMNNTNTNTNNNNNIYNCNNKLYKPHFNTKIDENTYNLTYSNFQHNNNLNEPFINNYFYKEIGIPHNNLNSNKSDTKKKSIEKYIFVRKNNIGNNANINFIKNNNNSLNQKNFNSYYNNNRISYRNIPISHKKNNNNILYKKRNDCQNNIYSNKDIEDRVFIPINAQLMKKYSFDLKKDKKLFRIKDNKNYKNNNIMHKNISSNKIIQSKRNKTFDKLISSSSSSDELSILADEIINKFHKKKLLKKPIYSDKKLDLYNNPSIKLTQKNKISKTNINNIDNIDNINNKDNNINENMSNIKNTKKKKIKSLIIPMNINNLIISNHKFIKNSDNNNNNYIIYNNNINNIKDKTEEIKSEKKNIVNFIPISQNKKISQNLNLKKFGKNNNIPIPYKNNNNNIVEEKKEKINNIKNENKNEIKKEENKSKNNESNDDDFSMIDQIMKNVENEEKNKKTRHINFNLENNIFIYYKSKDLITKNIIYKGNEKIKLDDNDEKKMDLYYALLKSKTKFNPIIKHFNKNEIKINKDYVLNEDLEEYEILGDLYNIFYSKDINDLDNKLKKSMDIFMNKKK